LEFKGLGDLVIASTQRIPAGEPEPSLASTAPGLDADHLSCPQLVEGPIAVDVAGNSAIPGARCRRWEDNGKLASQF
jgi:hypothetical protein